MMRGWTNAAARTIPQACSGKVGGTGEVILGGPDGPPRTVVGIVGDVRQYGLDLEPTMQVYVPQTQYAASWMKLVVRTSVEPATILPALRRAVWSVDPDQPVSSVATMNQLIGRLVGPRRFTLILLGVFATTALLLAAVGIYGVIASSVGQRTHEIGVRMALGAQRYQVMRLVLGEGMVLTALGMIIGLAGAVAISRTLSSLLYEVTPTDPMTLASVVVVLGVVALAACSIPAHRATAVDPLTALRQE